MLNQAETHSQLGYPPDGRLRSVRRLVGKLLWPFLRHQITVNKSLIATIEQQSAALAAANQQIASLVAVEQYHAGLARQQYQAALARSDEADLAMESLRSALGNVETRTQTMSDRIELTQRQTFSRYQEGTSTVRRDLSELSLRLAEVEDRVATAESTHASTLDAALGLEREMASVRTAAGRQFDQLRSAVQTDLDTLRASVSDQMLRLAHLDLHLAHGSPADVAPTQRDGSANSVLVAARRAFASTRADVRARFIEYLTPHIDQAGGTFVDLATDSEGVLDALRELGIDAYGLTTEANRSYQTTDGNFHIREGDALTHLADVAVASLGGIVASANLVEHLSLPTLVDLIERALLSLRSGGLLVLEARNPRNGAVRTTFYDDPDAVRPLSPELLRFLVEGCGFTHAMTSHCRPRFTDELRIPAPEESPWAIDLAPILDVVNRELLGPTHYAVAALRP